MEQGLPSFQAMKEQISEQQSSPLGADKETEASGLVLGGGRPPETWLHRLFWSQKLAWALAFHARSNDLSVCGFLGTRRYTEGHSRHVRQEFLQTDPSFSMYWETPSTLLSFRVCQQALDSTEEQSKGERRLSGQYGDSSPGGKPSPELCVCVWEQQREKTGFISWVLPTCKAKPAASKCCLWGDAQAICSKHEYSWSLF